MKDDIHQDFQIDYDYNLGSGAFGDVFRGIWKSRGCYVAIKRIKEFIKNAKEMMDEEVNVMNNLKHQNVLNFLAVVKSEKGTFLIIEFCEGGSLEKEIQKGIPEINCFLYLKQIVDGMNAVNLALHIHRDIKPENILFTKQKILKLCDFGLARRVMGDDPNKIEKFSAKGTPLYSAPQILRHQQYSGKCDVWSAGVILVQMLTKINPFHKAKNLVSLMNLQQKLNDGQGHYVLEGNFNPWFKFIVSKMIAFNQADRWSFYQLKQRIDMDTQKILKQYGKFDAIPTTVVNKQQAGTGDQTMVYVPQAKYNINDDMQKLKFKKKVDELPGKQAGGRFSKIQEKLSIKQANKKLLIALKSAKLFADIGTKYFQTKQVSKPNGYKFIVLFLSISLFMKTIQKIISTINKQTVIVLPDNTQINFSNMDQLSQKEYDIVRKDYNNQMSGQLQKFHTTIAQINGKMFSDKYQKEYPQLMTNYIDILQQLKSMNKNSCTEKPEFFQQKFKQFFMKECLQPNINNLHEGYIRIYWICLNLANIDKTIPQSKFRDNYIVNQIAEDSVKLPINYIKSSIQILQNQLI